MEKLIMETITSLNRVLTALSHKEPDKVPLFLLFSVYGAKVAGASIQDYFSNPNNVIETQLHLQKKYKTDCLYSFHYASLEIEAFGGKTFFREDGPPTGLEAIIKDLNDIDNLKVPIVKEAKCLDKVLNVISGLKKEVENTVPIIGVVMSPFSLPIIQLGFDKYLELLYENEEYFNKLMAINEQFCIDWANSQLSAGATAICYFDPVASSSIIPPNLYKKTGFQIAKRTISKINGPTATHLASGRSMPILEDLAQTGTAIVGVSSLEKIEEIKAKCQGKISILGNLNGIEMCRWKPSEAENIVKDTIKKASKNGGFILAENHGEIPYLVQEQTLEAITNAVEKYGYYT